MSVEQPRHRIREARLAAGLSQEKLAERLGCDRAWIVRLENSTSNPRLPTFRQIATALGIPMTDLLPAGDGSVTVTD